MPKPFLLEIGVEEIPDWMILPALESFRELFSELLETHRMAGRITRLEATPRRLVLMAEAMADKQADSVEILTGPPKAAGESAAAGFARKLGVEVTHLETAQTPKGEYFSYRRTVQGRATLDILSEALPELILGISFPKTMYWTVKGGPRFIRPIRWLVALLGKDLVPFEVGGVRSGNVSSGHRRLGRKEVRVTVRSYEKRLQKNFVLVSAAARREKIKTEIAALLAGSEYRLKLDATLLETLVYLTEYPTPIVGAFSETYLDLPAEVLVTVMRHHQKYFSVLKEDGHLAPFFVAVMNSSGDPDGLVRSGNERVLRARFNDARFFWQVDQQKKLADRVEDLANVTFQAKLGSYRDKTDRVVRLVEELGGGEPEKRAALLAKCDLTTEMVKEFTELQGIVGGLYARAQDESEPVWRAVYEHYKPLSMDDSIPSTPTGQLVALADKLDTLRGCFSIGLIPSGSRDPFALRRAAQGVVRILVEGRLPLPLSRLTGGDEQLREFLLDRVQYYFREIRGSRYDEVNAIISAGCEDLVDAASRLEAIGLVRPTENFEPLAASFKRIQNILRQAEFAGGESVRESLLEAGQETELHAAFAALRPVVEAHRRQGEYRAALEAIATLRPKVDAFFDHVLVNAPDADVRRNRLALLHHLLTEFSAIADFSQIAAS